MKVIKIVMLVLGVILMGEGIATLVYPFVASPIVQGWVYICFGVYITINMAEKLWRK